MNRLTAFGVVCVAAIVFSLVAYDKLGRGGSSPIIAWNQGGERTRIRLKAASTERVTGASHPFPNSSDIGIANNVNLIPAGKIRVQAEVVEAIDEDFSSSSLDDESVAVPAAVGERNDGNTQLFGNQDSKDLNANTSPRLADSIGKVTAVARPMPKENDEKPVHIIVLARMRTGSSLVGEIFNQNPSLFYIFEPLHAGQVFLRHHSPNDSHRKDFYTSLLRSINICQFPSYFLTSLSRWGLGKSRSSGLSPICKATQGCTKATRTQLEDRCKSFSGRIGMKTIRADLRLLQPLVEKDHLNVKVIHLVRDPRGTANSRKSYYRENMMKRRARSEPFNAKGNIPVFSLRTLGLLTDNPKLRVNTITSYCRWIQDAIPLAQARPKWLEGRYMLVRYEDLALDPIKVSQDIYDFVGMTMPKNVREWVVNNTMADNQKSKAVFSTHKNSTEVMQSWRQSLSFEEVNDVQRICAKAMSLVGYKSIQRPEELTDMNYNVIEPLPRV